MRKLTTAQSSAFVSFLRLYSIVVLMIMASYATLWSQCTPESNTISGTIFEDQESDGSRLAGDLGLSNVLVTAYNRAGVAVGSSISDNDGNYSISGLSNDEPYRLEFESGSGLYSTNIGEDSRSAVQFIDAPACSVDYGLYRSLSVCGNNPALVLTCFVQGTVDENSDYETLISLEHNFDVSSKVDVLATHGQTGSIWGVVHDVLGQNIYSSAFVKQYAGLKHGPYAILKTELNGGKATSLFADLSTLVPQALSGLSNNDVSDCLYGNQVGRLGLGNLIISPDSRTLYTAVLDRNLVVGVNINDPKADNTQIFSIPRPLGIDANEEFKIFALEFHEGLIYVGGTVTGAFAQDEASSQAVIMTLDPGTGSVAEIFRTAYLKGYWQDSKPESLATNQWFTDISFNNRGEIIMSLSDRVGHRYCRDATNRVDQQYPDILMVAFNETTQTWQLESNGVIAGRQGSGFGNGEGPGGGEFFGYEHWTTNATYHNETALGSSFVLPGSDEVVVAVYDPLSNSYSGGLHRYSTTDGAKVGAVELYSHTIDPVFGKATGFGDITAVCGVNTIEIGNFVWYDSNSNGLQDADEKGIEGVVLNLYNAQCDLVATTTTNAAGNYVFNDTNVDSNGDGILDGVFPTNTYFVEIDNSLYDANTGLYTLDATEFTICTSNVNGNTNDNIDCDIINDEDACLETGFIQVNTIDNNHTFDIALGAPRGFDLALKKEIIGNTFAIVGEELMFGLTVYNQGGVSASEVEITDYIPNGYIFDSSRNPGWKIVEDGKISFTFTDRLLPGAEENATLRLTVSSTQAADYVNVAEISEALDLAGNPAEDIDSTPDDISTNDNGGEPFTDTDDQINDNGAADEDDHDPAIPNIFDLAVRITLGDEQECYYANDLVKFDVKVYNQGNTDADLIKISDRFPVGLVFNQELSTGWSMSGDKLTLTDTKQLAAGATRDYCVFFNIAQDNTSDQLINYVEIEESSPVGHPGSFDFDSTPDESNDNDQGGEVSTSSDNQINDLGLVDEDDHDPVMVPAKYVDLALAKTTVTPRAKAGGIADFEIEVFNQGGASVSEITLFDYLPDFLSLEDDNWTMIDARTATRTITLDQPLISGNSVTVSIRTRIADGIEPQVLVNFAEIAGAKDRNGTEIGVKDIDSTPDQTSDNDRGGEINTSSDNQIDDSGLVDEDDQDPAMVIIIDAGLESSSCLENAVDGDDGQYADQYKLTGPSGDGWYIFSATNYYENTPGAENALPTGPTALVDEMEMGNDMSMYTITVLRRDGQSANIIFRSNKDDVETFTAVAESYTNILTTGDQALCNGGVEEYCIVNPTAGVTYTWTAPTGAIVTPNDANSECVTIDWNGLAVDNEYDVVVSSAIGCVDPHTFTVGIGSNAGAVSCLGSMNISLDSNCEVVVDPDLILTSPIGVGESYSVELTTPSGEVIPNATLTPAHIGMTVMASVKDACSGNSCWGTILVEDKLKPTIECIDVEVACNKIDEFEGPFAQDNCGGDITVTLLNESVNVLSCGDYVAEITRSYQATDAHGNKSDVCEMTMFVERVDLDDIVFPKSLLMMDNTALNCDQYDPNMDGIADLDITGRPLYNNEVVYPDFDQLCNTAITFEDEKRTINGIIKITRTWTAWEWYCSETNKREYEQYIEIRDTEAPMITCPADLTISAFAGNCEGTVELPLPMITDACSDNVSLAIRTPFGGLIQEGDSRIVSLPFVESPYTIEYIATDESGNQASCEITVTVIDNIAPVAICDQNTTVGLNSNGEAYTYAQIIDDGSYDACGVDVIEIRRMDIGGSFSDRVEFGCDDIPNNPIIVELRVTDLGGLTNTCMVNVFVQDKHAPEVSDLDAVEIECGDSFEPLSQFGTFTFNDACEVTTTETADINITDCGTGTITRIFIAADSDGADTAYQTITVVNSNPFDGTSIVFPRDTIITTDACDMPGVTDPANLPDGYNYPTFDDDLCDMVAAGFEDTRYNLVNDPTSICQKVVRKWTVADWCQKDAQGNPREFIGYQTISVISTKTPDEIEVVPATNDVITTSCDSAIVSFTATSGGCNPATLQSSLFIDIDGDFVSTGIYEDTIYGIGSSISFMDSLPLGSHTAVISFTNACGNTVTTTYPITVSSDVDPSFQCIDTNVALSPWDTDGDGAFDTEGACISVYSLVDTTKQLHACDEDVQISFSPDAIVTEMCFTCPDLGENEITVYGISESGNIGQCVSTVTVQDLNDFDICNDVKDCASVIPTDTMLFVTTVCSATVAGTSLDVVQQSTECGGALTITHDYTGASSNTTLEGATFPLGTTTVTWTITNGTMTEICQVNIQVKDEVAPQLIDCDDVTIETSTLAGCSFTQGNSSIDPTATDNCTVASVQHDYTSAPSSTTLAGATFPLGTTTVVFTVTDNSGNQATCQIEITVVDNESPTLICAGDTSFPDSFDSDNGCDHTVSGNILDPTTSDDECNTISSLSHDYTSAPNSGTLDGATFDLGTTTVTWFAVDEAGNVSTCTVDVTVTDDIAPSVTCAPSIAINEDEDNTEDCQYTHSGTGLDPVAVIENCDDLAVTLTHDYDDASNNTTLNGATFPVGVTTVVWTVTDAAGNSSTCDLTVTVGDDNAPECIDQGIIDISIGGDQAITLTPALLPNDYADECGVATITFDPPTLDCDPVGETTVVVTVTDIHGNASECDVIFNVIADLSVSCEFLLDTIFLDATGMETLVAADVVAVTGGGCGIANVPSLSKTNFDCTDAAASPVEIIISNNGEECATVSIPVVDRTAPTITCAASPQTIGDSDDNTNDCQHTAANGEFDPAATDACGNVTFTHDYAPALSMTTLDGTVFPVGGPYTITWTATDAAGNQDQCTIEITVVDDVDPTCVDQGTISITIETSDTITITEDLLPNAYTDNCEVTSVTFDPVSLDCSQAGTVAVTATVVDAAGNVSECPITFELTVNEEFTCSFNVDTIFLNAAGQVDIDPDIFVDVVGGSCGVDPVVTLSRTFAACNDKVTGFYVSDILVNGMFCSTDSIAILDTVPPMVTCSPATITCLEFADDFGSSLDQVLGGIDAFDEIIDNCTAQLDITTTIDSSGLNECNYGVLLRTTTATDFTNGASASCTQEITISGPADPLTQADVDGILMDTVTVIECSGGTPDIDTISVAQLEAFADCGLFAVDYTDVSAGMGCPDTITRTYTVDADCQDESFEFVQIVIINDDEAPVVAMIADTTIAANSITCSALVDFAGIISASDNCSSGDDLEVTFSLDGVISFPADTSMIVDAGTYDVVVTATDGCTNTDTEAFELAITDDGEFLIGCEKIIAWLDGTTAMVDVSCEDALSISGVCNDELEVICAFDSTDLSDTIRTYGCEEVDSFVQELIYVWYIDAAGDTIPYDFSPGVPGIFNDCKIQVEIRDTSNACMMSIMGISGNVLTPEGLGISEYQMTLHGSDLLPAYSEENGHYAFDPMPMGGNYRIGTYNNNDVMNGVTTLDLIMIQRHILGLAELDSPYKLIAADINNSESITGSDLLALRKMVLGINTEFPNNHSWRAIDAAHEFVDATNPWATEIPEGYDILNLSTNMYIDFIGVKIGDINGNVDLNLKDGITASTRSAARTLEMEIDQDRVEVYAPEHLNVAGMQFAIQTGDLTILDITSTVFDVNQLGFFEVESGVYNVSIASSSPIEISEGQSLFTIEFDCIDCNTAAVRQIEEGLDAEIYLDEHLEVAPLALIKRMSTDATAFAVSQNNPNPWNGYTDITVVMEEDGDVAVRVYDVNGRVVYNTKKTLKIGENTLTIDDTMVSGSGVFFYEISTSAQREQYKMIKLK